MEQLAYSEEFFDIKSFFYRFPILATNATPGQIFDFLNCVSYYCMGMGIFAPPPHTMQPGMLEGAWGPHLETDYLYRKEYKETVLLQALTSKGANLGGTSSTQRFRQETNALRILNKMAQDAGYPALSFGRIGTSAPRQGNHLSLQAYVQAWMNYLHIEYLHGVFHSDRYMLECFARNLNNCYAATLRPHLITLLRTVPNNTPVPQHWQPEHLTEYICFNAPSVGIYNPTPESTPRDSQSSTSRSGRSSVAPLPPELLLKVPPLTCGKSK